MNLTNAHRCRASQLCDVFHKALGRRRAAERLPAHLGRRHMPAFTRSEINDDSSSAMAPITVNMAFPIGLSVAT